MKFKNIMIVLVSICMCLYLLMNLSFSENIDTLEGAWVIYEGAQPAPDVMVFMPNGNGICYDLSDEMPDFSWVQSGLIENGFLLNPRQFIWKTEHLSAENGVICFLMTLTVDDSIQEYHAIIEPDLAGTGRYGLTLSLDGGKFGGGWLKTEQIQASP
ncbi:MAG: hypothetical protein Q4G19_05630 [Clostridia bacterium]|nr:hypothetical protein [Clostridia bacterium]